MPTPPRGEWIFVAHHKGTTVGSLLARALCRASNRPFFTYTYREPPYRSGSSQREAPALCHFLTKLFVDDFDTWHHAASNPQHPSFWTGLTAASHAHTVLARAYRFPTPTGGSACCVGLRTTGWCISCANRPRWWPLATSTTCDSGARAGPRSGTGRPLPPAAATSARSRLAGRVDSPTGGPAPSCRGCAHAPSCSTTAADATRTGTRPFRPVTTRISPRVHSAIPHTLVGPLDSPSSPHLFHRPVSRSCRCTRDSW